MEKYQVVLFQPYLRQFVLNFGKILKHGTFVTHLKPKRILYNLLPSFDKEIVRVKTTWQHWLRRIIGIPNVRFRYETSGDILFTYGTLLITNKPYCVYLETGLSPYNYDLGIARNPFARLIVMYLATRKNCHKLIFLSEASKKSFFTSAYYPKIVRNILTKKMVVIYPVPLVDNQKCLPKKWSGTLRLLFVGQFYMKGGQELVNAFLNLRKQYSNISLTIITPIVALKKEDADNLLSQTGINLHDAVLGAEEMRQLYRDHHVFCLPTYRDGFGLVLIEAIAHGMPLIITDQYATTEMVVEDRSGFVFHNHPLQDYDPKTYQLLGKYYNPRDFYQDLFDFQKTGKLKPVENFLYNSIERFLLDPSLLEKFSIQSLDSYNTKFNQDFIAKQLDTVFLECIKK